MSASIKEIYISLKRNGFDISLLEVEEIMAGLVEEGFIERQMPSRSDGQDCFTDAGQICFPYIGSNCSKDTFHHLLWMIKTYNFFSF